MFPLYLTSLILSAGTFGLFVRQALQSEGYVPGLAAALALTLGAASIYLSIQLAYMATVQLLKPTRSPATLFSEILSHLAALVFVPFLLGVAVPWPHNLLEQLEPLIYLGIFAVIHGFFKLMTFFAAMRGAAAARLRFALWLLGGVISLSLGFISFAHWADDVRRLRPTVAPTQTAHAISNVYTFATDVPEGVALSTPLNARDPAALTLRVAIPSVDEMPEMPPIYLDVYLYGRRNTRYSTTIRRRAPDGAWQLVRVPPEFVPSGLASGEVLWSTREESRMRKLIGIRPIQTSAASLRIAGPHAHAARVTNEQPSFVIVSVEGLSAAHLSTFGYDRKTTRALDRLAAQGVAFTNAYSPAPDAAAATMSVLTGLDPVAYGRVAGDPETSTMETLAAILREHGYATALFSETGEARSHPLAFGAEGSRGFEYVDSAYAAEDPEDAENPAAAGSKRTLERARAWIEQNSDVKFFLFVRLRELADLEVHARYGEGLTKNLKKSPPPKDVYDSALAYMDGHLGAFLKYIRDQETRRFTCVTVLSPHGVDFVAGHGKPAVGLTENALRVPLIMQAPGLASEKRDGLVSLTQVAPTLLSLAAIEGYDHLPHPSVLDETYEVEPVSVTGDPLVMALRKERWLFVWQSGRDAATLAPVAEEKVVGLYQITRRKGTYTVREAAARNAKLVQTYRDQLMTYAGIRPLDGDRADSASD